MPLHSTRQPELQTRARQSAHWSTGAQEQMSLVWEWTTFPPAVLDTVHAAFPRDGFAEGMADLLEDAGKRSPQAYAMTFMTNTVNRLCGAGLPDLEEQLRKDPFATTQEV